MPPSIRPKVIAALDPRDVLGLLQDFPTFAHRHQVPDELAPTGVPWRTWLLIGGRGAGKTRAGAEWVKAQVEAGVSPIALVGESEHDAREVMIEGVSGLMSLYLNRSERPVWIPSRHRLEWPKGQVAYAFSAEDPESLRGPQFAAAWCDELAKWRHADKAFDMLQFGLRLGDRPRQVITTTPRPIPLLKRLMADPATVVTRAGTSANKYHLAPDFLDAVMARYGGTRLGRQEIDGEVVEERAGAMWSRALIEQCRVAGHPPLQRIVVAVDPPASSGKGADACGLVAAGRAENGTIYVIADETMGGLSPTGWAQRAISLWRRLSADALVVEVNQGGDMVKAVINGVDPNVPVTSAYAMKGKWLRAEPVASMYEQGRVKHAGVFPELEDEMCDFGLGGLSSGRSPDRLDALVWAVTALTYGARTGPRVRAL
ncbi:MAG: terminase family protein [Pseudomonadota bacterium]